MIWKSASGRGRHVGRVRVVAVSDGRQETSPKMSSLRVRFANGWRNDRIAASIDRRASWSTIGCRNPSGRAARV